MLQLGFCINLVCGWVGVCVDVNACGWMHVGECMWVDQWLYVCLYNDAWKLVNMIVSTCTALYSGVYTSSLPSRRQHPCQHLPPHLPNNPTGMLIQYLLPLSTALLFITPLVTYVAIPSPLLSWARAGSLFSCSILQVLLFRGYIQTYLSSAMVMWYRVGQSTFATTQPEQAAQFVVGKMEAQLVLLPKVAVQMLGLGVLWGCCGLLLGLQCLLGFEKTQGGATSHAVYTALPALVAGAQFVGVMTTSLHWVYTTLCLVLLQTGYMQT